MADKRTVEGLSNRITALESQRAASQAAKANAAFDDIRRLLDVIAHCKRERLPLPDRAREFCIFLRGCRADGARRDNYREVASGRSSTVHK